MLTQPLVINHYDEPFFGCVFGRIRAW